MRVSRLGIYGSLNFIYSSVFRLRINFPVLVSVIKARADVEAALKQFMDQESQANIVYINNKRKIWSTYTNQLDIAYGF